MHNFIRVCYKFGTIFVYSGTIPTEFVNWGLMGALQFDYCDLSGKYFAIHLSMLVHEVGILIY